MSQNQDIIKNINCPCSCKDCAWDKEGIDADSVQAGEVKQVAPYASICGSTEVVQIGDQLHQKRGGRFLPVLNNTAGLRTQTTFA